MNKIFSFIIFGGLLLVLPAFAHGPQVSNNFNSDLTISGITEIFYTSTNAAAIASWNKLLLLIGDPKVSPYWIWLGNASAYDYANCGNISSLNSAYGIQFALKVNRDGATGNCSVVQQVELYPTAHNHTLNIVKSAGGNVIVSPAGTSCGADCLSYPFGILLTLTAAPDAGFKFAGWGGDCGGIASCSVGSAFDRLVTATFIPDTSSQLTLTAKKLGNLTTKNSAVADSVFDLKFTCGSDCSETYNAGASVTLYAQPEAKAVFNGWTATGMALPAACSGAGAAAPQSCAVAVNSNATLNASFLAKKYSLTIAKSGNGGGAVVAAGINCDAANTDCSQDYNIDSGTMLQATADSGSNFIGWTGCNYIAANFCVVDMVSAKLVSAQFDAKPITVAVVPTGDASGTVTGAGINCPGDCSETYTKGASVNLTASPASGSTFTGWSGACASAGTNLVCSLTIAGGELVTANFYSPFTLNVLVQGPSGSGTVASSDAKIHCGSTPTDTFTDCSADYAFSDPPISAALNGFAISPNKVTWIGCDSNPFPNLCVVAMDKDRTVTAKFGPPPTTLTVSGFGNGSGSVNSTPVGISCAITSGVAAGDCSEAFLSGGKITLTQQANSGSKFNSWSLSCSGTGNCVLDMSGNRSVAAVFTTYYVDVIASGVAGKVTSNPAGFINCGTDPGLGSKCSSAFLGAFTIELNAAPTDPGVKFNGWIVNGSATTCPGISPCVLNINGPKIVTANFGAEPNATLINLKKFGSGDVALSSDDNLLNCSLSDSGASGDCSRNYPDNTSIVINAFTDPSLTSFIRWSGCDSVAGNSCSVVFKCDSPSQSPTASCSRSVTAVVEPAVFACAVSKSVIANFSGILPVADIKADGLDGPITLPPPASATITWTSLNADSCVVAPTGWSGISGSQSTGALASSQTYILTCTNAIGSATDSVTINVLSEAAPPVPPPGFRFRDIREILPF